MAALYKYLKFYEKTGSPLNFLYDDVNDTWVGTIYFDRVSTGLYENQHIFLLESVLIGSPLTDSLTFPILGQEISPVKQEWATRWSDDEAENQIFTYVLVEDANNNPFIQDFEEIVYPNTIVSYVQSSPSEQKIIAGVNSTPLKVNIAFSSDTEDIYERVLIIEDRSFATPKVVATVTFHGETVGEDDRFALMLENFGRTFNQKDAMIVSDVDIKEPLPNWLKVNEKRKELLLAGEDIYPYIGSYRGLINVVKFFGYHEDLRIKEYWLNIDANSEDFNKIQQFELTDLFLGTFSPLATHPLVASTQFKKTSMFGLFYDITVATGDVDQFGIPTTKNASRFTNEEVLIKLFALKDKLKKEFLPLNARIIDIVGEGIYFERYEIKTWTDDLTTFDAKIGVDVNFGSDPSLGYIRDLRKFQIQRFSPGLDLPVDRFTNLISPYTLGQAYPGYTIPGLIDSINAFYNEFKSFTFPYTGEKNMFVGDEPGIVAGCPVILSAVANQFTWDDMSIKWDDVNDGYFSTKLTADYVQPAAPAANMNVSVSVVDTSWMLPSISKDMFVPLTGTTGSALITVGNLTRSAAFNTNLPTTASDFTTAWASDYAAIGIILTNSGSTLRFTSAFKGWDFSTGSTTTVGDTQAITTAGAGYTNGVHANANFSGGTGTGFQAALEIVGGSIVKVYVTNYGTGYTTGDILTPINSGDPPIGIATTLGAITIYINNLAAIHTVATAPVNNVIYINGGGYYQIYSITNSTTVVLYNFGYEINAVSGSVVNLEPTITVPGTGYDDGTHTGVVFTGGTGSGFQATVVVAGGIIESIVQTAGSGYIDLSVLTPVNGTGTPSIGIGTGTIKLNAFNISASTGSGSAGPHTWDTIDFSNFYEIEWTIEKAAPNPYSFTFRGPVADYHQLPHFLPYAGKYDVTMTFYDTFNAPSIEIKTQCIEVLNREIEIGAFCRFRNTDTYTWDNTDTWDDLGGSAWYFPIEGTSPSASPLNEKLTQWARYENQDDVLILDPSTGNYLNLPAAIEAVPNARRFGTHRTLNWENMDLSWDEMYHSTWDMYDYHADFLGGFKIYSPVIGDGIQIDDYPIFLFYDVSPSIAPLDLFEAAAQLNASTDIGISKFTYTVRFANASPANSFIHACAKFPGPDGWHFIKYYQTSPGDISGDPYSFRKPTWLDYQLDSTIYNITAASNTTPIIIDAVMPFVTGQTIMIADVLGNTAANGTWVVKVLSGTQFSLNGSIGNAAYSGGGIAYPPSIARQIENITSPITLIDEDLLFLDTPVMDLIQADSVPQTVPNAGTIEYWQQHGYCKTEAPSVDFPIGERRGYLPSAKGSGAFSSGNIRFFTDFCEAPLGTPIFIVNQHSEIPGKQDFRWVITNEVTGEVVIDLKGVPFVIFNFIEESIYTIESYVTDSNGNMSYGKKKGFIKVSSRKNMSNTFVEPAMFA